MTGTGLFRISLSEDKEGSADGRAVADEISDHLAERRMNMTRWPDPHLQEVFIEPSRRNCERTGSPARLRQMSRSAATRNKAATTRAATWIKW